MTHPKVDVHHAAEIELHAEGVSCWADGERIGALPVTLRTLPGALRVFRPARRPDRGRGPARAADYRADLARDALRPASRAALANLRRSDQACG